ncbi:MAG TPA: amidohydrolase family protein [Solirubrobacterales bacterium]|nr:amidohydrolase family protein [Solirubrobacterales bacterium]
MGMTVVGARLDGETVGVRCVDGVIEAIGVDVAAAPGDETLEAGGAQLVAPLLNGHTHAAMTLFRGSGGDLPLMPWLQERIWPVEAKLSDEDVYWGARLACAEMVRSGTTRFWDMYWQPAATARAVGDGSLLGRAALGFAGQWSILGRVDASRLALLEEARERLSGEDSALRARLLARLALELYYSGDPERRLALSEQAVALARRLGDARTLAVCLDARHYALWRPENVHERLDVAAELRGVAQETGDPELELEGAGWTVVDLLELGDVQGADVQIAAASKLAEALQRPIWLWWTSLLRCTRAQLAGRFEEAERLAEETLEIGRRGQAENAVNAYAQAMFNIRREQGRLAEVEPAVRRFIELYPMLVAWRAGLALLLVELDRHDEARAEFARVRAEELPRDANWLIAVTLLAEVCGALGDGSRAESLYALLEPYAGRNVVVGRAATCNGAASRLLGVLAAAMRAWELAEGHFISALAMHERMGARPWVARTQVAYAEMLLARRRRGDKARAGELLKDAVTIAETLGMPVVAARARSAGAGSVPLVRPAESARSARGLSPS